MWTAGKSFLEQLFGLPSNLSEDRERLQAEQVPMSGEERRWIIGSTLMLLGVSVLWMYLMLWY